MVFKEFQNDWRVIWGSFVGIIWSFKKAQREFQGPFKGISREFSESFLEGSWEFQGCFKKDLKGI